MDRWRHSVVTIHWECAEAERRRHQSLNPQKVFHFIENVVCNPHSENCNGDIQRTHHESHEKIGSCHWSNEYIVHCSKTRCFVNWQQHQQISSQRGKPGDGLKTTQYNCFHKWEIWVAIGACFVVGDNHSCSTVRTVFTGIFNICMRLSTFPTGTGSSCPWQSCPFPSYRNLPFLWGVFEMNSCSFTANKCPAVIRSCSDMLYLSGR